MRSSTMTGEGNYLDCVDDEGAAGGGADTALPNTTPTPRGHPPPGARRGGARQPEILRWKAADEDMEPGGAR